MMREWEEKGFDAIITLASPMPAISPEVVSSVITGACYTAVYNLTGCPAGDRTHTYYTIYNGFLLVRYSACDEGDCRG